MKRTILLILTLAIFATVRASAEGVTLRTVSCFAGEDAAAIAYAELLRDYEERTGCVIEDASATSDEGWKARVLSDFAVGNEPDVLFFFACSADSAPILRKMVPISEINAAYPALDLMESDALRETDGVAYAIPARPYYEGLFVNVDLFERYDLPLPDTWDHLEQAVIGFAAAGVTPIAVSFSDIPHYLAECCLLACASPEEYAARPASLADVPESWVEGMALIRRLYELGAFPADALNTSETVTSQLFRDGKAAMQFDGSWFANTIPAERMDAVRVLPVPRRAGEGDAVIGGVSMGFYLTRRAWDDPGRRDAAVGLLAWLTAPENLARLSLEQTTGALRASAQALMENAGALLDPVQDDMNKDAREAWLLNCVPAVADGAMTPEQCWEKVMGLAPFSE